MRTSRGRSGYKRYPVDDLGTLGLTLWFVTQHANTDAHLWLMLATLLTLLPASEAVIAIVNRLISESVLPRRLPRLALADGIPPEQRALVVIPALLAGSAEIRALARRLEHHYLANAERHAQFALLTDYVDADAQTIDEDARLLGEAVAAIDMLESAYPSPSGSPQRFLLLHRERRWSQTERQWIGLLPLHPLREGKPPLKAKNSILDLEKK